jgi:hypothetical protein
MEMILSKMGGKKKSFCYFGGKMMAWEDSYVGQLRKLVGHMKLIVPSIRAIIQDEKSNILFIREVREETGLQVHSATLIAIYTDPRYSITNSYGDEYQGVEFLYRVDDWSGQLSRETDETLNAEFYSLDRLPQLEKGYWGKKGYCDERSHSDRTHPNIPGILYRYD